MTECKHASRATYLQVSADIRCEVQITGALTIKVFLMILLIVSMFGYILNLLESVIFDTFVYISPNVDDCRNMCLNVNEPFIQARVQKTLMMMMAMIMMP